MSATSALRGCERGQEGGTVGNNAAQASAGHMETHRVKTDQRGKVQTVCRDSTLIDPALFLGHRLETPMWRAASK